jgi:hypothetical protein
MLPSRSFALSSLNATAVPPSAHLSVNRIQHPQEQVREGRIPATTTTTVSPLPPTRAIQQRTGRPSPWCEHE